MTDKITPPKTSDNSNEHPAIRDSAAAAYEPNVPKLPASNDTARQLPPATIDAHGITFGPSESGAAADQKLFSPSKLQMKLLDPTAPQGAPDLTAYNLHDVPEWTGRSLNKGETRQKGYVDCSPGKALLTGAMSYFPFGGERLVNASGYCSEITQKTGPGKDGKPFVETTYSRDNILDLKLADGEFKKPVNNVRTEFDPKTGNLNIRITLGGDDDALKVVHFLPDGTITTEKDTFEEPRMVGVPTGPTKIGPDGSRNEPSEMMEVTAASSTYKPDGTHFTDYDIANKGTIRVQYKSDQTVESSETLVR